MAKEPRGFEDIAEQAEAPTDLTGIEEALSLVQGPDITPEVQKALDSLRGIDTDRELTDVLGENISTDVDVDMGNVIKLLSNAVQNTQNIQRERDMRLESFNRSPGTIVRDLTGLLGMTLGLITKSPALGMVGASQLQQNVSERKSISNQAQELIGTIHTGLQGFGSGVGSSLVQAKTQRDQNEVENRFRAAGLTDESARAWASLSRDVQIGIGTIANAERKLANERYNTRLDAELRKAGLEESARQRYLQIESVRRDYATKLRELDIKELEAEALADLRKTSEEREARDLEIREEELRLRQQEAIRGEALTESTIQSAEDSIASRMLQLTSSEAAKLSSETLSKIMARSLGEMSHDETIIQELKKKLDSHIRKEFSDKYNLVPPDRLYQTILDRLTDNASDLRGMRNAVPEEATHEMSRELRKVEELGIKNRSLDLSTMPQDFEISINGRVLKTDLEDVRDRINRFHLKGQTSLREMGDLRLLTLATSRFLADLVLNQSKNPDMVVRMSISDMFGVNTLDTSRIIITRPGTTSGILRGTRSERLGRDEPVFIYPFGRDFTYAQLEQMGLDNVEDLAEEFIDPDDSILSDGYRDLLTVYMSTVFFEGKPNRKYSAESVLLEEE